MYQAALFPSLENSFLKNEGRLMLAYVTDVEVVFTEVFNH